MPRPKKDLQQLARAHTASAVKTLVGIMEQPKASDAARVKAAEVLLNRGWGMAKQEVSVDAPGLAALLNQMQGESRGLPQELTHEPLPSDSNGANGNGKAH